MNKFITVSRAENKVVDMVGRLICEKGGMEILVSCYPDWTSSPTERAMKAKSLKVLIPDNLSRDDFLQVLGRAMSGVGWWDIEEKPEQGSINE